MNTLHRVKVLGRELQVRSTAPAEAVREVESFVNEKLAEVAASVKTNDLQIIAILALMNIAEAHLALVRDNESFRQQGREMIARLLQQLDGI